MLHPLIKKAFLYPKGVSRRKPRGFFFDEIKGLWSNGKKYFVDLPPDKRFSMGTKKADRETGEDQKGA